MTATTGIVLAVVATIFYNLGFIVEKRALDRLPPIQAHRVGRLVRTLFGAPGWVAGFALICCGLALQVVVLSLVPLTIAQPLQASGVVVTIVFSWLMLRERLGGTEFACVGLIGVAVLLLSLSAGNAASKAGTHAAAGGVALAAVPVAVIVVIGYGWGILRPASRNPRGDSVRYGFCAGLVYGYAGLCLKGLSAAVFGERGAGITAAIASPYLYVMLAVTAVGMCLFQTALQRGRASIVMPVSLVMSTGYLVVVGSWLFHERLPATPAALVMRLAGGVAAVIVPVILANRTETRRIPA